MTAGEYLPYIIHHTTYAIWVLSSILTQKYVYVCVCANNMLPTEYMCVWASVCMWTGHGPNNSKKLVLCNYDSEMHWIFINSHLWIYECESECVVCACVCVYIKRNQPWHAFPAVLVVVVVVFCFFFFIVAVSERKFATVQVLLLFLLLLPVYVVINF